MKFKYFGSLNIFWRVRKKLGMEIKYENVFRNLNYYPGEFFEYCYTSIQEYIF
jgi:hypothetical protein